MRLYKNRLVRRDYAPPFPLRPSYLFFQVDACIMQRIYIYIYIFIIARLFKFFCLGVFCIFFSSIEYVFIVYRMCVTIVFRYWNELFEGSCIKSDPNSIVLIIISIKRIGDNSEYSLTSIIDDFREAEDFLEGWKIDRPRRPLLVERSSLNLISCSRTGLEDMKRWRVSGMLADRSPRIG